MKKLLILIKNISLIAASFFFLTSVHAAADSVWNESKVSPGISTLNSNVTVAYSHTRWGVVVPPGSTITQVHANHAYTGNAMLQTYLCWNGLTTCVQMIGNNLNSSAFSGLDASKTMYLVHRVIGWGSEYPPIFIPGAVTVWFN